MYVWKKSEVLAGCMTGIGVLICAVGSISLWKEIPQKFQMVQQIQQDVRFGEITESKLKTEIAKRAEILENISLEEQREQELLQTMEEEFPQLKTTKLLQERILVMENELEPIQTLLRTEPDFQYDVEFASAIDENVTADLASKFTSWFLPGMETNNQIVFDQQVQRQVAEPTRLLRSYSFHVNDCMRKLAQEILPLTGKLAVLRECSQQMNVSNLPIPEYTHIQVQLDALEQKEYEQAIQKIYDALAEVMNGVEQMEKTVPILMEPSDASELYQQQLASYKNEIKIQMERLEKQYALSLTPETEMKMKEKRKESMDKLVELLKSMEGDFRGIKYRFLESGSVLETYRAGDGRIMMWGHMKGENLALIRQIQHEGSSEYTAVYYLYDQEGQPMAIVSQDPMVTIYGCDDNILYSSTEDPAPYLEHAIWLKELFHQYRSSDSRQQNQCERELKEYMERSPL